MCQLCSAVIVAAHIRTMEDVGRCWKCWKTGFSMVFPCFPRGFCSTRVEKVQASPSSSWGSACRFGPWHGNAWRISGHRSVQLCTAYQLFESSLNSGLKVLEIVLHDTAKTDLKSHWLYDCCCADLHDTLPPLCRSLLSLWGNSSKRRPQSWPIYKIQLPRQSGAPQSGVTLCRCWALDKSQFNANSPLY